MIGRAVIALAASLAVPALADEPPTAMWYVAHTQALRYALMECRNDPGNPRLHHQCVNVTAAQEILGVAEDRHAIDMTPPSNPSYWRIHPQELGPKLASCSHFAPGSAEWHGFYCDSAHAAVGR